MSHFVHRAFVLALAICTSLIVSSAPATPSDGFGTPPLGFTSEELQVHGTRLHYVRGGNGPAVILVHGFPEDWTEYRDVMPRLAKRFTVVAVDLPGLGKSAAAQGGYHAPNLASHIHALVEALKLQRPYVVGHDLGAIVTYAYVRSFPESLRGAMILDVPMPGLAGWDESTKGMWHIGFIQVPGLAEQLIPGRQAAFLGNVLDIAKFTQAQRAYYFQAYDAPQLHAAFEIYRGFPADAQWNAAHSASNSLPLTVAVGEKSFFAAYLPVFVEGYRAAGMTRVESARIPEASHYLLADNAQAVGDLIERKAQGKTE